MENKKFMIIESRGIQGFFSNFLHTLQYLYLSEKENRIPIVDWRGGVYAPPDYKGNVWNHFFKPVSSYSVDDIKSSDDVVRVSKYKAGGVADEPKGVWDYTVFPPEVGLNNPTQEGRNFVRRIIDKYIVPQEFIEDRINSFFKSNMELKRTVGVHIRYCNDMRPAQGEEPLMRFIRETKKYISSNPDSQILFASDYKVFSDAFKNEFAERILYTNCTRSEDGNPVQYACKPKKLHTPAGFDAGVEVIIDCYLLSKCDFLLHGFSNVSSTAMFINPIIDHKFVPENIKI